MPKRTDIHKIMVIGSGPIVIGQAAEFDYAGTQACLALKEEGYEVVLCNSNPATIMTDPAIADKVYMEPLTAEYLSRIVRVERPDALIPGLGGQTGLNLAMELSRSGVLKECGTELLGTRFESIRKAEDREEFKKLCEDLGEPVLPSLVVRSAEEGMKAAAEIGFPMVLRPAFTLGGTGGGFAETEAEFPEMLRNALAVSPVHEVLLEKSVRGYKEIEYEVMRDANDTAITICNMENLDPVGIHTGDSIVVCPSQTLTNKEYQMLRDSALRIIRALEVEGGCNVQFALDPNSFQYYLIEVNPRVSRSSALASKASGYPIARVSAKICAGLRLDEIRLANTPASFEPALDYVVTKMPRFPFDKFAEADHRLGTQMKATGEVMSVGRTFEESLLKAVRSLETGVSHLRMKKFEDWTAEQLFSYLPLGTDDRIFAAAALLRLLHLSGRDPQETAARITACTGIDRFFVDRLQNIIDEEEALQLHPGDTAWLSDATRMGFSDAAVAELWDRKERDVREQRRQRGIRPVYKMIDSCAGEFDSYIPYFYSTYEAENESVRTEHKKVIVLGSGPIRIGQGVEFDYSTVHAVQTLRDAGYEAIIINNNPETVSTDYTTADKLYFEPLTVEDVLNIIDFERPEGVIATLGGQTAVNLAAPLTAASVHLIGTDGGAIARAEDRDLFEHLLLSLGIPQPEGEAVTKVEAGIAAAKRIGYPVLVRPSFVLGGRAMQIVSDEEGLRHYLRTAVEIDVDKPVLVDRYIRGKELEVDAVCDGKEVFIPGIMELMERTGVHSGDSISVYPTFSVPETVRKTILDYTRRLGLAIGIIGLFNIQFIADRDDQVYIIEVNPRSSRTVPFLSKATGYHLADIATHCMLGQSLRDQGITEMTPQPSDPRYYVKAPAFSFSKLHGMDAYLSPEMKSTGEAIGYDRNRLKALYKAMQAAGMRIVSHGIVLLSVDDHDKEEVLPLAERFVRLGFTLEATAGTADFLQSRGIRCKRYEIHAHEIAEASSGIAAETPAAEPVLEEIFKKLRDGSISYFINTRDTRSGHLHSAGTRIRECAVENGVPALTSPDTVRALLDALEEVLFSVGTIGG
ncbi:MAG: carbamoyl-phosphate synthase large subunit [Stomatobaculum sp.]|nr:carbamoyl-phosphate synthase large subunit [Stomatobaculum sp.]